MKVVTRRRYGGPEVLAFEEASKPTPKSKEVLIRIRATTVTSGDCRVRALNVPYGFALLSRLVFGIIRPRQTVLGSELAGVIEAIGGEVSQFRVGDRVFAFSGIKMGCYAEYKCIAEDGTLVKIPANLSYEEVAALSFGGTTALDFFRRADLRAGEHVLINAASGAVGTAAIQIAKHYGAKVTAVCSATNADLVRAIGADDVIDYRLSDFTDRIAAYDVVFDAVGTAPLSRIKASLRAGGRLLLVLATLPAMLRAPIVFLASKRRVIAGPASERAEDLHTLAKLAAEGVFKPVIDRSYRFEEIAEAHRYVDTGRKRGNVVITVS
jgi:NADPH:quinone reductase-like Zn-dependent oxidoreductase